jgi:diadenosine tetraphosphate (Ap4A) HIT family hydrolase
MSVSTFETWGAHSVILNIPTADHAEKMHQLPDEYLADAMPVAKKIALALGAENYNVLQVRGIFLFSFLSFISPPSGKNNGKIAHQVVPHVHFHVIPKPSATDSEGLVIGWPAQSTDKEELARLHEELKGKL